MKLIEITEAKAHAKLGSIPIIQVRSGKDMGSIADKTGKWSGEGIQTTTTKHKSGKIVKHTTLRGLHDPAAHWVDMCMHNAHNPYIPKYQNVKIYEQPSLFRGDTQYTMISTCEQLFGSLEMRFLINNHASRDMVLGLKLTREGAAEMERNCQSHPDWVEPKRHMAIKLGWLLEQLQIGHRSKSSTTNIATFFADTNLIKAFELFAHMPERFHDIHGGNWMFRESDGHLVLNDPLVYRKEPKNT